uniref:Uncharacterized protein n=2 Tax=Schistocephalus solidus TaxID=70667 RepID=A0A0X3NLN9_SCHSO
MESCIGNCSKSTSAFGRIKMNRKAMHLQDTVFVPFCFLCLLSSVFGGSCSSSIWFRPIAKALHSRLVHNAYYAKCLVNCPLPDSSCESIAYGAGLSRAAAMENAAYYASAKGHRNCGHYIRDCEVQQYKKPTSHVNAGW